MSSIFTKIINGDIPCYKIAEDANFIAFLDISPLKMGHTLIVPKIEIDYIFDLETENYLNLMKFSRKIAIALKSSLLCKKVGMAVIGFEVPHAHIHLIPINTMNDMNFNNEKLKLNTHEFETCAEQIRAFL